MLRPSRFISKLLVCLLWQCAPLAAASPRSDPDPPRTREVFVAALQRVRQDLPDTADSTALQAYPIYDYLVAARLKRDLAEHPGPAADAAIEVFLQAHSAQPVTHGLRHDWLLSLAERRRWDQFLPRSVDATDPLLVCDRLAGRLATGDTEGLGAAALARWLLPLKPAPECSAAFAW